MSDTKQALMGHLLELRKTLLWVVIAIGVAFVVILTVFCQPLLDFVTAPIKERGMELIYTALTEAFSTQMKLSLLAAIVVTFPVTSWLLWRFIRPALYQHERRTFIIIFLSSLCLFVLGIIFAYVAVLSLTINFFVIMGENAATPMISISQYVSFLISFLIPFGLVFLMPLVSYVLTRMGVLTATMMTKYRKYLVFAIFVISAVLTPPDVISQIVMALPMLLLYEVSIIVSKRVAVKQNLKLAQEGAGSEG